MIPSKQERMGLGSTAKKIQRVADVAEKLYTRVNELREEVNSIRETVAETEVRVNTLETEAAAQRALLEALAEREGLDVEQILADAPDAISSDGEATDDSNPTADGEASSGTDDPGNGGTVTPAGSDG